MTNRRSRYLRTIKLFEGATTAGEAKAAAAAIKRIETRDPSVMVGRCPDGFELVSSGFEGRLEDEAYSARAYEGDRASYDRDAAVDMTEAARDYVWSVAYAA